ncbi:MAG: hypothetical protein AAGA69_12370 [Pseudomonadota bacterium]
MSDDEANFDRLLAETPRMPDYLCPAAEQLMERMEPVASSVSTFLQNPVRLGDASIRRQLPDRAEPGLGDVFDVVNDKGVICMRISLSAATVSSVTRSLFGGDVTEKPVLSGIGLAFCRQVASALVVAPDAPQQMDEDGEPIGPLAGYDIIKADPDAIGARPVLTAKVALSLIQPPDLELVVEFPRTFTDRLSSPKGALGDGALKLLSFPITAVAGTTAVPFGEIRTWKVGDEIQLPGAEISNVAVRVSAGTKYETLAHGELGAEDGLKSIRLHTIGAKQAPRAPGTPAQAATG